MSRGHVENKNFIEMKKMAESRYRAGNNSIASNILSGVGADSLFEIKCKVCAGEAFYPVHTLKFASKFQTKNGMPTMVQFPLGFACSGCGEINPWNTEEIISGSTPTDQDGQKQKQNKEEKEPGSTLGISVSDGTKTSEKVG